MRERLLGLPGEGWHVVVGSSFWQRARRREYKELIERAGGRWRLIYLQADPALLGARLHGRAARFDANAAFPINEGLLARRSQAWQRGGP